MKKKIWILNHFAGNMLFDKGGRHYSFAKYLKANGYEPVIFCANTKHSKNEKWIETNDLWIEKNDDGIETPFVYVRASLYGKSGRERIINMISFYFNVKKAVYEYAQIYGKPDIIMASSVHPLTLLAGIQIANEFGIKCICEVRDLWPESIVAYKEKLRKRKLFIRLLYDGERYIYKSADCIVFTFEGGYQYILNKGWEKDIPMQKVFYINNGVDLEDFIKNQKEYIVEDEDLDNIAYFNIVYTGSIRPANNLDLLLDSAKKIKNGRIKFLIWGQGSELERLKKRVEDEQIDNVCFKGRVNKQFIPSIVSRADICFAHNQATEMDYKYGISFNKIFDYFAAGKPILCDFPCLYNPVIAENAGFEIACPDADTIAKTIEEISNMDQCQYKKICNNSYDAAKKYDYKRQTEALIEIIERL